jgi:hypothetical protein
MKVKEKADFFWSFAGLHVTASGVVKARQI